MKQPIRFIYFDVGGVLLDWVKGFEKASEKYHTPVSEIYGLVKKYWDHVVVGGDTTAYMKELYAHMNISKPHLDVTDFWTDHHEPIQETHAFVIELKKTFRLGLLTNAERNAMHYATQKRLIPSLQWDIVVDSSVQGVAKPDARIYEIAEKMAGVSAQEIFYTDDVPEYVEAAKSRGWHGIVFDTNNPIQSIKAIKDYLQG